MEVKLDKRYPLDVDAERAWQVLRDVKAVAGCMPGASITEQIDDTHYKGGVKVKIGPASTAFAGDIEVLALDEATRTLRLMGKGADRSGSSASMDLTGHVEPGDTPTTSALSGIATVTVSGKFAQFGSRLIIPVSDALLAQFADNFRALASAVPAPVTAPTSAPETIIASEPAPAPAAVSAPAPPAPSHEINALALAWHVVKGWVAGLFGKRR